MDGRGDGVEPLGVRPRDGGPARGQSVDSGAHGDQLVSPDRGPAAADPPSPISFRQP